MKELFLVLPEVELGRYAQPLQVTNVIWRGLFRFLLLKKGRNSIFEPAQMFLSL